MFALRISLPDKPGVLGSVATHLSGFGINIVTLDVIEVDDGCAVDDLTVEFRDGRPEVIRAAIEEVPGVLVESIREVDTARSPLLAPLELAAQLSQVNSGECLTLLANGLPGALSASWAWVVQGYDGRLDVIAASGGAPSLTNLDTPWLPLDGTRRLAPAQWMPPAWRMGRGAEAAATPFLGSYSAVLVVRRSGPRFRNSELRQLDLLSRIAGSTVLVPSRDLRDEVPSKWSGQRSVRATGTLMRQEM